MTMAIDDNSKHSQQLKLSFDPFDPDEPTSHFFPGANRQELLDKLIESCCYSSDLAVVTGPLGSGKSTLAQWLALNLDNDFVAVPVRATLFMSAEQLLEAICEELSLEFTEGAARGELVEQLDQYAETLRGRAKTLQLLVDDAHELGEEGLQVVLDLLERQADSSRLGDDGIKVVLFGESMLLNSVQQLLLSAHNTFELEPLTADEVVDYVAFKLAGAGYHGRFPLDMDAMTVIEARSQGIPGAISAMVQDQLVGSISQRSTMPALGFLERHLVAASVLFGALLLALFFTLGNNNGVSEEVAVAATSDAEILDAVDSPQRIQVPLEIPTATNRQPAPNEDSSRAAAVSIEEGEEGLVSRITESRRIAAAAEQAESAEGAATPVVDINEAADRTEQRVVEAQQIAENTSKPEQPPTSKDLRGTDRGLLARSPESYTLQLLGSHSEDNVKNFIASNNAPAELNYFESRHQDRPWFVVVHGNYPDRTTAREAIDLLPSSLRELQPWARNLSEIQQDIRKYE